MLLAALAVSAAALAPARRAVRSIDLQMITLLPRDKPRAQALRRANGIFGQMNSLYVAVEVERAEDLAHAKRFADVFAPRLALVEVRDESGTPTGLRIESVDWRTQGRRTEAIRDYFRERAYNYVTEEDARTLAACLSPAAVDAAMARNLKELRETGGVTREKVTNDPLGLFAVFEAHWKRGESLRARPRANEADGYRVSPDGRLLLVIAHPNRGPGEDARESRLLMAEVERLRDATLEEMSSDDVRFRALVEGKGLTVGFAGGYPTSVETLIQLSRRMPLTVIASILGVLALYMLAFRRPTAALYTAVPLCLAVLLTLGAARLFFDRITVLGAAFAATIIGLGVDFSIHLYNRTQQKRADGLPLARSTVEALEEVGPGLFYGAVTSALAFFGVAFTDFRGFRELGLLAGCGVALSLVAMVTVLPALLIAGGWLFPRGSGRPVRGAPSRLRALGRFVEVNARGLRRAALVLFVGALAAVVWPPEIIPRLLGVGSSGSGGSGHGTGERPAQRYNQWGVNFDCDLGQLGPSRSESAKVGGRIGARLRYSFVPETIVVKGHSAVEALEKVARLEEVIRREYLIAGDEPPPAVRRALRARDPTKVLTIESVESLLDHLPLAAFREGFPPPAEQEAAVARLRSLDLEAVESRVREAARRHGLNPEAFRPFYERFAGFRARLREPERVSLAGLARIVPLLRRFAARERGIWHMVLRAAPLRGVYKADAFSDFEMELARGAPGVAFEASSARSAAFEIRDVVLGALPVVTAAVTLLVAASLLAAFRSVFYAMAALVPLAWGLVAMLAVMKCVGLDLNYINVIVFPVVIGIGIDDAIHVVHRFRTSQVRTEAGARSAADAVAVTGRAIVLTSLTTMVGFASLALSEFRGLISLGLVAVIGVAACLVGSLFVLPAILEWRAGRERAGGEGA